MLSLSVTHCQLHVVMLTHTFSHTPSVSHPQCSHTLILSESHTHSLIVTHPVVHSITHILTLSHTPYLIHHLMQSQSHTLSDIYTLTVTHSIGVTHILSHTCSQSYNHTHSHIISHTGSHALSHVSSLIHTFFSHTYSSTRSLSLSQDPIDTCPSDIGRYSGNCEPLTVVKHHVTKAFLQGKDPKRSLASQRGP